ncbi:MAG: ABC transporter permease [Firmicutes bacterium]|nr:ABC transporter permease [Bacillota bacterium]
MSIRQERVSRTPGARFRHVFTREGLSENAVPLLFFILCTFGVALCGKSPQFLIQEIITRLGRNTFTVMSLTIPVVAGLGLNFGIVLGAMAGQTGLFIVTHLKVPGIAGLLSAVAISIPLAVALGLLAASVLNRARGHEMIAGMILGFFMNGVYQFVYLFLCGTVFPIRNPDLVLPQGFGLRNTVELKYMKYALDNLLAIVPGGILIPVVTFAVIAATGWAITALYRTKLGQDFRAVGQNMHIAEVSGINVDRTRTIALVLSTVLASTGHIIFLQNVGTINTYNSHEQVGMFAIAALLVGGATVVKATVGQAVVGTLLFHLLFIVSPYAGQRLMGNPQVGEYFRVFVAYAVIGVVLFLHALERARQASAAARR